MNLFAFITFILVLQGICFLVGRIASKQLESQQDYFLAGRTISFFPLLMTFVATQVGGGLILGAAEEAYRFGWVVLLYPLGGSLGLIALGMGFGSRLAKMQVSTIAEVFEVVYQSSRLKQVASILSIITFFMIFIAQIIASHKFISSMGVENNLLFFVFWGIVIFYTAAGGLKAVVATDIIQALFFIVAFVIGCGYVFYSTQSSVLTEQIINQKSFDYDATKFYGWLFLPFIMMLLGQDMGQRCFAADSAKTLRKATIFAGIIAIVISLIPIIFGIIARNSAILIPDGSSVFMRVVEQKTTPLITALMGCAILAAIISTADSLLNAISSNLSQDFKLGLNIRYSQVLTTIIALLGIILSFQFNNVVDVIMISYELSICCLFVPFVFAVFNVSNKFLSACFAIAFGLLGFILFKMISIPLPKEFASLCLSVMGFYIGETIVKIRSNDTFVEIEKFN